jgi:hypothetical protein
LTVSVVVNTRKAEGIGSIKMMLNRGAIFVGEGNPLIFKLRLGFL